MGTRARILIKDKNVSVSFHCNWDGYPSGIGYEIKSYLKTLKKWRIDDISKGILENSEINNSLLDKDRLWQTTCDVSTEDYIYVIDTDRKTLRCYEHDYNVSLEDTCIPKNRRYIRKG